MKDNKLYLEHMLEAVRLIEEYSAGFTFESFSKNTGIQDAITRRLEIIGEAANRVPQSIKDNLFKVPWTKIIGMRNVIVHDYMYIDIEEVWDVVQNDLPQLKKALQEALDKIKK